MDQVAFAVHKNVPIVSVNELITTQCVKEVLMCGGGLAQMVERSLSMREVPGSIPGSSNDFFFLLHTRQPYFLEPLLCLSSPPNNRFQKEIFTYTNN